MASIVELLGDKILTKEGVKDTTTSLALAKDEVLGLYFSAHWCGPCRGFTPVLSEFYKKLNTKESRLKIVFLSSDRSQEAFDEYYGEMPWLALPYENREKKEELSRKFKVEGIPTLILLDSEGARLQTDGDIRELISKDPQGTNFPWPQTPMSELLTGSLTDKNGETSNIEDLLKSGLTLGIYFSAHWCPPCRDFTPKLAQTYQKVKDKGHKFEIIFASSDKDEESFKDYLDSMPWKALPFKDPRKEKLSNRFNVEGIPTLVIISPQGKVITTNGRSILGADQNGDDFPWKPKPVNNLLSSTGHLNDTAAVILFTEGSDEEVKAIGNSLLFPVAEKLGTVALPDNDDTEVVFISTGGDNEEDLSDRVRQFARLPSKEEKPSLLVILNIPEGQCYVHDCAISTSDEVQKVVDDFRDKKLTFRGLRG